MPVWVVCSESHFTVLFASDVQKAQAVMTHGSHMSLSYYDGLAKQEQPIKLTITKRLDDALHEPTATLSQEANHLVPPLEHVIHTKWPNTLVSWNGFEPIL